jgi:outer membrane protein assembly factor BamB
VSSQTPERGTGRPRIALIATVAVAVVVVIVGIVLLVGGGSSDDGPAENAAGPAPPPAAEPATPATPAKPAKPSKPKLTSTVSGYPNVDRSNTRHARGTITAANVDDLEVAWTRPLSGGSGTGSYAATPVIIDGVVYSQDLNSNVEALDQRTGKVLWSREYNEPNWGPNGITVGGAKIYGATTTTAFALDRKTGRQLWKTTIVRNSQQGIDMAPGYHQGKVYVSTVPGNPTQFYGPGSHSGILYALDAKTGKRAWTFNTAPTERWSSKHTDINVGGGLWYPPSFDGAGNMYFGVGNPGPFAGTEKYPWGSSRPGRNPYTNSLVKLDAATGKLKWYFQLTPHDLYDWDLQDPPILTKVKGKPAVVTAGKAGFVIAVDRASGRLLWKTSVGTHNGHDDDHLYAMKRQYSKLKLGVEVFPGLLGGVIAPMATDGKSVFVPVVNGSTTYVSQEQPQNSQGNTGEVVALDLATGKQRWTVELATPAYGATTVTNDLVFTTTYDGTVHALDKATGDAAWQQSLPTRTNSGVAVEGDTLIAPAGVGQGAAITAYRLGGGGEG